MRFGSWGAGRSAVALLACATLGTGGLAALEAPANASITTSTSYTVPAGDCSVTVASSGGSGGAGGAGPSAAPGAPGHPGASLTATFPATTGAVLALQDGTPGTAGVPNSGGSGGGATTATLDGQTLLSAAGGAGGDAGAGSAPGAAGQGSTFAAPSATNVNGAGPGPTPDGHGQLDITPNACPAPPTTAPSTSQGAGSPSGPVTAQTAPGTVHAATATVSGWPAASLTNTLPTDPGATAYASCSVTPGPIYSFTATANNVNTTAWADHQAEVLVDNFSETTFAMNPMASADASGTTTIPFNLQSDLCTTAGKSVEIRGPDFGPYDFDATGTLVDPVLHLPAPIDVAGGPGGTAVSYSAFASDPTGALTGTVTCNHPSGSTFQVGITTVICTADNEADTPVSHSFTVRVDDTPPVITVPGAITVAATGPGGANVTYPAPTVTDPDDSGLVRGAARRAARCSPSGPRR